MEKPLDVTLLGKEIAINRTGPKNQAYEDVHVAIRDAFGAAKRKIDDHRGINRGKVKTHELPPHGRILRIDRERNFGFVQLVDGQEIYFHRNSVVNGEFESLEIGSEVRLAVDEKEGKQGPQATTVQVVGKHHLPSMT